MRWILIIWVTATTLVNSVKAQSTLSGGTSESKLNTSVSMSPKQLTPGKWNLLFYGNLNRALVPLSGEWADTERGVGMDWGIGGGAHAQWAFVRWLAMGLKVNYAQWQVQRRFFENSTMKFSSDQRMRQLALMATIRAYPYKQLFIQPMGGGQLIEISHTFSDAYPSVSGNKNLQVFRPSIGGVIGYEFRSKRLLTDVGIHYQLTPNQSLQSLDGPFHFVGIEIGIGWEKHE